MMKQNAAHLATEATQLLQQLPQLVQDAIQMMQSIHAGTHPHHRPGTGDEFWEYRPYQNTESAARIDWRQSAKRQNLMVRETEKIAREDVWLWCDVSPSMNYASRQDLRNKQNVALLLSLSLALCFLSQGETVRLLDGASSRFSHPRDLLKLGENLVMTVQSPRGDFTPPFGQLPQKGRILLVSDFLYAPAALAPLAEDSTKQKHLCLFHIADPAEIDFPFEGSVLFSSMESDETIWTPRAEEEADAYRRAFQNHQEFLQNDAAKHHHDYYFYRSDAPMLDLLKRVLYDMAGGKKS